MKRILFWLCSVFLLAAGTAMASPVSLYLNNQPYSKPVLVYKGQVFVALEEIASALGLQLTEQGRVLCLVPAGDANPPCPQDVSTALLYINRKPVSRGVSTHHGKVWISIGALASALGYFYDYNPSTQIADLAAPPRVNRSVQTETPSPEAKNGEEKPNSTSAKNAKESQKNPLAVKNMNWYQDPQTYEIRLSFDVANVSDEPVKGIVATLEYRDGYGKALTSRTFSVGTLDPGKSATEKDYWINPSQIVISPHVDLDWEGKKKEKQ